MSAEGLPGDFGRKLREARERRGISLRQIANSTKISIGVLEALERNDIKRLPGGIFGRAFVRSYAGEVGLDPEETIQEFIGQFPQDSVTAGHPTSSRIEDREAVEGDRRMAVTFLRLGLVSIPIAVVVLSFGTWGRRSGVVSDEATPTVAVAPQSTPVPSPGLQPPPSPEPAVTAGTPPAGGASASTAAETVGERIAAAPQPPSDRLTVGLSATRPCWISARVDGQKTIDRMFQAGDQRTVEVRRELVLTAGDAAAITLTLNGAEARSLGKAGEVVTARLNLANFRSYLPAR